MKKVWYAPNRFESYGEEEIKAVEECLRDGWLAGFGPRSVEFEEKVTKGDIKPYGIMEVITLEKVVNTIENFIELNDLKRIYTIPGEKIEAKTIVEILKI